jgi:hypothetical protein
MNTKFISALKIWFIKYKRAITYNQWFVNFADPDIRIVFESVGFMQDIF